MRKTRNGKYYNITVRMDKEDREAFERLYKCKIHDYIRGAIKIALTDKEAVLKAIIKSQGEFDK